MFCCVSRPSKEEPVQLTLETNFDDLDLMTVLSEKRSSSGIAFEVTDQFKRPRANVQSKARERLEGYASGGTPPTTPNKENRPKNTMEDSLLPCLLSKGRAQKLHDDNEAKKQTVARVGTEQEARRRRLSDGLSEKASYALEKRKEVLAEISQKAKKHTEAVEDKLKKWQEAEEQRREELRARLERKRGSKVSGKVKSDGLESPMGAAAGTLGKTAPPARAGLRRHSVPERQPGSWLTGAAEDGFQSCEEDDAPQVA
jgi:hypothetical protein